MNIIFFYLNLAIVSCSSTLNQRNSSRQAHSVHMRSGGSVVERIQHQVELLEIAYSKFAPAMSTYFRYKHYLE